VTTTGSGSIGSTLTPLDFLDRAARMFAERVAVREGDRTWNYGEFYDGALRQASALRAAGVRYEDCVAVLPPSWR